MKAIITWICFGLLSLAVSTHVAAKTAVVVLKGDVGVNGTVIFQEDDDGIKITGNITGLTPNAQRGFHIQYAVFFSSESSLHGLFLGIIDFIPDIIYVAWPIHVY
jgi:hypothetical protein